MNIRRYEFLLVVLAVLTLVPRLPAEAHDSVYAASWKTDVVLGSASLGLFAASIIMDGRTGEKQSRDAINGLDRLAVRPYDGTLDTFGTCMAFVGLALPSVSALGFRDKPENIAVYGLMYSEAFLLTAATKDILKNAIPRWRPYTYKGPIEDGEYDESFPSGHTAFAFLGATFLAETLVHDYPDGEWNAALIGAGYAAAAATGTLRILAGAHFITDVLAGTAIGTFYGWAVPFIHRLNSRNKEKSIAVFPFPTGFSVQFRLE